MTGLHKDITGLNLHEPYHYVQDADPGAVGAGKYWLKTGVTPLELKRRNAGDSDWNAVGSSTDGGTIVASDLYGTAGYKTKMARVESITIAASITTPVIEIDGSGTVLAWWAALGGIDAYKNCIFRIYIDDEVAPSLEFDAGMLGYHHASADGIFSTSHIAVEDWFGNSGSSIVFKFPIPYATKFYMTIENPTGSTDSLDAFLQVFYTEDFTDARRLKSVGVTNRNRVTVPATTSLEFLDYSAGPGTVVWHSLAAEGDGAPTYLESDVAVIVDGEGSPSIQSTGTEDWFMGAWYYGNGSLIGSTNWSLVSQATPLTDYTTMQAIDLLALFGGIHFNDSINITWDCSESAIDIFASYLILYYIGDTPVPLTGGGATVTTQNYTDTRPTSPSVGDMVILKDGYWDQLVYNGTNWIPYSDGIEMGDPALQTWSWVNQDSALIDTSKGAIRIHTPLYGTDSLEMYVKNIPTAPYTITAKFLMRVSGSNYVQFGMVGYDSVVGAWLMGLQWNAGFGLYSNFWNSPTSFGLAIDSDLNFPVPYPSPFWIKVEDNNTNIKVSYSHDGHEWLTLTDRVRATYGWDGMTKIGFGMNMNNGSSGPDVSLTLVSWKEE